MRNAALFLILAIVKPLVAAVTAVGPAHVDFNVEVLFWRSAQCPYQFATVEHSDYTAVESLTGETDLGARIEIGFEKRCFFARIAYVNWGTTDLCDVTRPRRSSNPSDLLLVGLPNPPADADPGWISARARQRVFYDYFDLRLGNYLMKRDGCQFYTFANIRYLCSLQQKQRLMADAQLAIHPDPLWGCFEQNASYSGTGVGIGLGGEMRICRRLYVAGRVNSILIFGTRKLKRHRTRFEEGFPEEPTCEEFRDFNSVIPVFNGRVELGYRWPLCRVCLTAALGYELDYYWQAMNLTDHSNLNRNCHDLGTGGPFARLSLGF